MSQPVKGAVRGILVPALGRSAVIQRRVARTISQVYLTYPPGPPARQPATHRVLRGGRHILVVPAGNLASAPSDSLLRPYSRALLVITGDIAQAPGAS